MLGHALNNVIWTVFLIKFLCHGIRICDATCLSVCVYFCIKLELFKWDGQKMYLFFIQIRKIYRTQTRNEVAIAIVPIVVYCYRRKNGKKMIIFILRYSFWKHLWIEQMWLMWAGYYITWFIGIQKLNLEKLPIESVPLIRQTANEVAHTHTHNKSQLVYSGESDL